jgi:ATP-dependent RNA helicase DHX37/DHR1
MLRVRAQVWFGWHDWDMPPAPHPHPVLAERCAVFAAALLAGQVLPAMARLTPHLAAPPATACQQQGRTQPRVGELLAALVSRQVRAVMPALGRRLLR